MENKKTRTSVRRRGRGEGSISQSKTTGRWVGQVTLGIDPKTCKQIRKTFNADTRKEVAEWVNKQIADKQKGELVKTNKLTVQDWLHQWLNIYKKVNIKQTTYDSYNITINTHLNPAIGNMQLQKLNTNLVQKMINDMIANGASSRTIEYSIFVLSSALKQAIKNRLIPFNVAEHVELPKKTKKQITPLTLEQINKFKEATKEYYLYPAFLLQITTGIRRGEVLGLTWENVNLKQGYISIKQHLVVTTKGIFLETPKTENSIRDIPLTKEMIQVLKDFRMGKLPRGLVFTTSEGNYVHPRSYQRSFDMMLKRADIPKIRIHDLRHGFATQLLASDVDIKTVSELIGHSDVRFTANVYVHPSMDTKRKAIEQYEQSIS